MKVSYNWLKQYLDIPCPPEELAEILTSLGLEVEKLENYENIEGRLEGILAGHVIQCEKHPNAERLSVATVDIGKDTPLQIVCGAPNIAKGQKVLVAAPGTTIHPVNADPIKIKKSKIRGTMSEGMICAEDEVGLGTDHDGIYILPEEAVAGSPAIQYFQLKVDPVFDIDLTPNRADATSHIGIARDLLAYFRIQGFEDIKLEMPDVHRYQRDIMDMEFEVEIEDISGCPRYSGVCLKNVVVGESPIWMQQRLMSIGVRPINNIVDITNFVLHEIGQPLHAFDAEKIGGSKIIVKTLPKDSLFQTLDGQNRKLSGEDLMICNGMEDGLCIAGVFGGIDSGVTENTRQIFLESAYFDPTRIRRTSTFHSLRTDAAMIFEKGSDPNMTVYALKRAALLMREYCNAEIASPLIDVYPKPIEPKEITLEYEQINRLIGQDLPKNHIHDILKALNIEIVTATSVILKLRIPTNKPDVTRPADVIEEILRIHGFNNVPINQQITSSLDNRLAKSLFDLKSKISDFLTNRGWHEMMNLSLCPSKYYVEKLPGYADQLVYVNNTSNTHLNAMRPELLCPVLDTILYNQNRSETSLALFEFGRTYRKKNGEIIEEEKLAMILTGNLQEESWRTNLSPAGFFDLKKEVSALFIRLGFEEANISEREKDDRFKYKLAFTAGGRQDFLALIGEVNEDLLQGFGIKNVVLYAELNLELLQKHIHHKPKFVREISKYPGTRRDLALILDENVHFGEVEAVIHSINNPWIKKVKLFDVYRNKKQLGAQKKSYAISLEFEDLSKTLKDNEVERVMNKCIKKLETELKAELRK